MYAEIGKQVRRQGMDSIGQRAGVSGRRKLALLARASLVRIRAPRRVSPAPAPLPAIAWLVEASLRARPQRAVPPRSFDEKMLWATDLWARLAEHDQRPR